MSDERIVANIGAVKPIVVAVANGSTMSAWKAQSIEAIPSAHRPRCAQGLRVRRALIPLLLSAQNSTTGNAKIAR
jgi:hypothetical protein